MNYSRNEHEKNRHLAIGMTAFTLTAIVGTMSLVLVTYVGIEWVRILFAFIAFLGALMTGVQTFYRFDDRAAVHKQSAITYGCLVRKIDKIIASPPEPSEVREVISELEKEFNQAAKEAPTVPTRYWRTFEGEVTPEAKALALTKAD